MAFEVSLLFCTHPAPLVATLNTKASPSPLQLPVDYTTLVHTEHIGCNDGVL